MQFKFYLLTLLAILFFTVNSVAAPDQGAIADLFFQRAALNGYNGNVLVAQHEKIVLRNGYGWKDPEQKVKETAATVFDIGSVTKQFTGAAILKLQEQKKLSVNDPITKYFNDVPQDKAGITIHQLLTHTAGFPGAIGDDYELIPSADFMRLSFNTPLNAKPGEQYDYSNVGYSILGILVENLSGKNYEQYLHDELFVPAGMLHTGYLIPHFDNAQLAVAYRDGERWGTMLEHPWAADGPGWHLKANGGILSTLDDMQKWYIALRNKTVLNAASVKQYLTPYVKEQPEGISFYGYGWVIEPQQDGDTIIWHNGGNGAFNTYMGFSLKNDYTIIISSNNNQKIADDYAVVVRKILSGTYQPLDQKTIAQFEGNYKLPSGDILHSAIDETDRLHLSFNSENGLLAVSSDGTEDATKAKNYNERTDKIVAAVFLQDDLTGFATARQVPLEVVTQNAGAQWNKMKQQSGKVTGVKVIGSVARKRMDAYLTFVAVNFEKDSRYFIFVWKGENIDDWFQQVDLGKVFEQQAPNIFYAGNVDKTIEFTPTQMLIKRDGNKMEATRIK
ncbi:MAG: serine hydrolase domain-containing protein [Chitinophagales bacterium]